MTREKAVEVLKELVLDLRFKGNLLYYLPAIELAIEALEEK